MIRNFYDLPFDCISLIFSFIVCKVNKFEDVYSLYYKWFKDSKLIRFKHIYIDMNITDIPDDIRTETLIVKGNNMINTIPDNISNMVNNLILGGDNLVTEIPSGLKMNCLIIDGINRISKIPYDIEIYELLRIGGNNIISEITKCKFINKFVLDGDNTVSNLDKNMGGYINGLYLYGFNSIKRIPKGMKIDTLVIHGEEFCGDIHSEIYIDTLEIRDIHTTFTLHSKLNIRVLRLYGSTCSLSLPNDINVKILGINGIDYEYKCKSILN